MTPAPDTPAFRFGRFTLLPAQRRLLRDGEPAAVGSRAFDLLHALVARHGQVVPKQELLHIAWPDLVVEENNLHVQIAALRKLLGSESILTVSGRGYAFRNAAGVRELSADSRSEGAARAQFAAEATPMRGRTAEAEALARLVRTERLVTVTGPGGVGKSRLVREVVTREGLQVRHVDLGASPSASVRDCAARAFGLVASASADGRDADWMAAARPAGATLLLENAERAPEQAAEFASMADGAGVARIVCTSQAPLNAPGEHVLRLAPLPVPEARARGVAVLRSPAVEMLLDCMWARQSGAATPVADRDAGAICRHLDGLPLAIELAGARAALLGLAAVRRLLPQRFELLKRVQARPPQRQRSLRESLQWSWSMLTPAEREAFRALCGHAGPLTIATATRALAGVATSEWEAMDMVGALVDKSMLLADPANAGSFRMLESSRMFALAPSLAG